MAATGTASAAAAATRKPVVLAPFAPMSMAAPSDPIRLVTRSQLEPEEVRQLEAAAAPTKLEVVLCKNEAEFLKELPEAEVVYGRVTGEQLPLAKKLKWVQSGGAGVEFLIRDEKFRASDIVMTNFARTFAPGISETGMCLLLCLTRGLTRYYLPQFYLKKSLRAVGTVKSDHHVELEGRTMGIVGLGGIGSATARRAHYGFDMRVVATDAKPIHKPEYVAELHDPTWFEEMVPQVDVLVAAVPMLPETDRMFNENVFRRMKKTAYFLALSRGDVFDDMALVKALKEGWIAGAGLDVFPTEPVPEGHPIYECDNVVMTPHTSGWSPDRQIRLMALFADNVRRYARGLPLVNVVDKQRMY